MLTAAETRKLKALAKRELRSVGNCVGWAVTQHLRSRRKHPKPTTVAGDRRPLSVAIFFPPDELAELEARAQEQRRSLSSYVTFVVLEKLGK